MTRRLAALTAGLTISVLIFGALPAAADPATAADPFVQRVFAKPIEGEKTYACFIRKYDAAHLAQHPKQKVSSMKVLMTADNDAEAGLQLTFRMGLTFRNKRQSYESGGSCYHPEVEGAATAAPTLGCGVDCDGGGIEVQLTNDDKSVLVSLQRVRIWRSGRDDDENFQSLKAGADDHSFRLDRTRLSDCLSLAGQDEMAALRGGK